MMVFKHWSIFYYFPSLHSWWLVWMDWVRRATRWLGTKETISTMWLPCWRRQAWFWFLQSVFIIVLFSNFRVTLDNLFNIFIFHAKKLKKARIPSAVATTWKNVRLARARQPASGRRGVSLRVPVLPLVAEVPSHESETVTKSQSHQRKTLKGSRIAEEKKFYNKQL